MIAWALGFYLILLPSLGFGTEGLSIHYEELHDIIQKNNKAVRATGENVSAAEQRVGAINRSFLPKLGFEAGIGEQKEAREARESAPYWKIEAQVNLYRGGRDSLALLSRDSQILSKENEAQALSRRELFSAKKDYVELAIIRKIIRLTEASIGDYESLQKSLIRKSRAGLMTDTAVLNTQLEVDELKRKIIILQSEEHELEDRLNLILGLKADEKVTLLTQFTVSAKREDDLTKKTQLGDLPEIKSLALLAESLKLEVQSHNEWWRPDVNVFATYIGNDVTRGNEFGGIPEREMSMGIKLSIDLEAKSTLNSEASAKRFEISALENQREHLRQEINHKVHEYQRDMETQTRLIKTYAAGLDKSERLLKQLKSEFDRGIAGSEEISSMIGSIYEMKRKNMEGISSFFLAKAGLETMIVDQSE